MLTAHEPIKRHSNADFEYYFESALVDELNRQPNVVGEYVHVNQNYEDCTPMDSDRRIANYDTAVRILVEWNDTEYVSFTVDEVREDGNMMYFYTIYSGRWLIKLDPAGIAPELCWWIECQRSA